MLSVLSAEQMREVERETIEGMGLKGSILMETAGRAIAAVVRDQCRSERRPRILALCGPGNNGGDGIVAARVLREQGYDAEPLLSSRRGGLRGDAALHAGVYEAMWGAMRVAEAPEELSSATIIIDALLGTGLDREVQGQVATLIAAINSSGALVVAADIPSGLRADEGSVLGCCVRADHTVTMAFPKVATVSAPGYEYCGRLWIAEIGIPARSALGAARAGLLEIDDLNARDLFEETLQGHKGLRGHLLVVGGSPGMRGAGRLAGRAGLVGGAGAGDSGI